MTGDQTGNPQPPGGVRWSIGTYNAMRTLELIAVAPRRAMLLKDELGIGARTARGILHRLEADGYVEQIPTDNGRLGPTWAATDKLRALGMRLAIAGLPPEETP